MQSSTRSPTVLTAASAVLLLAMAGATAQENYASWELLENPFESTGGGGIMIGGYDPVIVGDKCRTDFTATEPGGKVYYNKVEFDAPTASGRRRTAAPPARPRSGCSSRMASSAARPDQRERWFFPHRNTDCH